MFEDSDMSQLTRCKYTINGASLDKEVTSQELADVAITLQSLFAPPCDILFVIAWSGTAWLIKAINDCASLEKQKPTLSQSSQFLLVEVEGRIRALKVLLEQVVELAQESKTYKPHLMSAYEALFVCREELVGLLVFLQQAENDGDVISFAEDASRFLVQIPSFEKSMLPPPLQDKEVMEFLSQSIGLK